MRKPIALALISALVLALAACGDDSRQAGGVTRSEAQALDDAAEMVNQQRLPAEATSPAPKAGPSAAPSPTAT